MTYTALTDVSVGSVERLHRIAHANGWDEIKTDALAAMTAWERDQARER